ncbi:MAG TPA: class I SAM-dependent methyltransferase, partial [Kiloniellales bacterium]|nr:class I SAM-dependent methyltransferase [Kiloniellales bacterium]
QDQRASELTELPYFDLLLRELKKGNAAVEQDFGRHVHWGYWKNPREAKRDGTDFAEAAENLSQVICQAARIADGLRVLDVGCGFGGTIAHINEQHRDMQLTGLNLDTRQLQRAQRQVVARPSNRVAFVGGDACKLPFADASLDVVLAVECIHHFPNREAFFQDARRVLKPGGMVAMSEFIPARALLPYFKLKMPGKLGRGFYGRRNMTLTLKRYREFAERLGFRLQVERDITANTIPTYAHLWRLSRQASHQTVFQYIETGGLEVLSRLRLLRYMIYAFQRA